MRKKGLAAALAAFTALGCMSASAELTQTYESVVSGYGQSASRYISQVAMGEEILNMVYVSSINGAVDTECNIRSMPSAESEKIVTIGPDAKVKVWGITDNEWYRIMVKDVDGKYYFGYMKATLIHDEVLEKETEGE